MAENQYGSLIQQTTVRMPEPEPTQLQEPQVNLRKVPIHMYFPDPGNLSF